MKTLSFEIALEQPVIIARPSSGEENSSESYDFIPGSSLRGAFISLYLHNNPGVDISHHAQCRHWFFNGEHCFLNAYPVLPPEQRRMLPTPLSWRVEKEEKGTDYVEISDFAVTEEINLESPVALGAHFAQFVDPHDVVLTNTQRTLSPHNASISRQVKRAEDSFVFQYDVLTAGQTLSAAICGPDVDKLQQELEISDGMIMFLGGSRSANYGRARLHDVQLLETWQEYTPLSAPNPQKLIITLLSDAILVDNYGNSITTPAPYLHCQPIESFRKTRLVGGFNRKWGLPLPQATAVMAGSVFVFDRDQVDRQVLADIAVTGIGERRAEGFGRIAIDWNTLETPRRIPMEQRMVEIEDAPELCPDSKELAQRMAERQLRMILNNRILEAISLIEVDSPPNKTQLSQLRQAAKNSLASQSLNTLRDCLEGMKQTARQQFEGARVTYSHDQVERLGEWLKMGLTDNFNDEKNFWKLIDPGQFPSVAGETIENIKPLQVEYVARFVEGLMTGMIRKMQQSVTKEGEK